MSNEEKEQSTSSIAANRPPLGLEAIHMTQNLAFANFFIQNYAVTLPQSIDPLTYMNAFRGMILLSRDRSLLHRTALLDESSTTESIAAKLMNTSADDREHLLALRQLSTTTCCVIEYLQRSICLQLPFPFANAIELPDLIETKRSSSVDCKCCLQTSANIRLELSGYRLNMATMASIDGIQFELQLIDACKRCAKSIRLLHKLRFVFIDQMKLTIRRIEHRMSDREIDRADAERIFIDDYTTKKSTKKIEENNNEERYWHQLRCLFDEAEHV